MKTSHLYAFFHFSTLILLRLRYKSKLFLLKVIYTLLSTCYWYTVRLN